MWAICLLTLQRMRDGASIMIFLIGCVLAYFVSGLDYFEITQPTEGAVSLLGSNRLLFGTIIVLGLTMLVTIFNAASEIPRDIKSRQISMLLTKPISRGEYVMGKYLGILMVGLFYALVWVTIIVVARLVDPPISAVNKPFDTLSIVVQYLAILILLPVTAIGVCFSCWFSDMVSMIITTAYIFFSFLIGIAPIIASLGKGLFGNVVLFFYFFFPNLSFYFQSYHTWITNIALVIYTLCVTFIFLLIGMGRFQIVDIYERGP